MTEITKVTPEYRNLISKGFLQVPTYDELPATWDGSGLVAVRGGTQRVPTHTYYVWDGDSWEGIALDAEITAAIAALNLASGVYTPTLFNTTNVAASGAYQCQYIRVGSVVTVSGRVDVDPTAAANTVLGISLPIASNLGAFNDLAGAASNNVSPTESAALLADAANDRANMQWTAVGLASVGWFFTFTYRII